MPKKNISLSKKPTKKISMKRKSTRTKKMSVKRKSTRKSFTKPKRSKKMSVRKRVSRSTMFKRAIQQQCRSDKIKRVMGEFKRGDLKLVNGKVVTNRKQAIAIALSQANRYC